jgi:GT2 family glycosyltransferase
MKKRVDVVVLNWNGWQDALTCLSSLQKQDYANAHLLLVDNGSTDGSIEHIRAAMPSVELLPTGANLGFGGGCNVGIRHALARGADYVWLINSDATVDAGALSALVRVAEAHPQVGAVGSILYEADQPEQVQLWGGGTVNLWLGRSRHRIAAGKLDFISGASMLLRRSALEEVGLFDQVNFFMYWEDTDIGFRLRKAGWQLAVANDSRVWHKQSASLGKRSPLLDEYFARSGARFLKRYAPVPLLSNAVALSMRLVKRVLMGDFTRAKAVLRGFLSA